MIARFSACFDARASRVCLVAMFPCRALQKGIHWCSVFVQTKSSELRGSAVMLVAASSSKRATAATIGGSTSPNARCDSELGALGEGMETYLPPNPYSCTVFAEDGAELMNAKDVNAVLPYEDIPAILETYVDGIHMVRVEPNVARITMCIARWDEIEGKMIKNRRVTAARIVMPSSTIVDFYNQLHRVILQMEANGAVSRNDGVIRLHH